MRKATSVLPALLILGLSGAAYRTVAVRHDRARAASDLERLVELVQELETDWRNRDFERAPAWGKAEDGAAFDAYVTALDFVNALSDEDRDFVLRFDPQSEANDTECVEDLRRRSLPALEALSQGAHCTDARPPLDWRDYPGPKTELRLRTVHILIELVRIEVMHRLANGDGLGAVKLTLDAATLGNDITYGSTLIDQMIGSSTVTHVTSRTWSDADLARLDTTELAFLEAGLAKIGARQVVTPDGRSEGLVWARHSLRVDQYSSRLHGLLPWILRHRDFWEEVHTLSPSPWPNREQELSRIADTWSREEDGESEASVKPFMARSCEVSLRHNAALLRVFSHDVALRAGSDAPIPADPFGDGPLRVERDGDAVHISSLGPRDAREELSRTVTLPSAR